MAPNIAVVSEEAERKKFSVSFGGFKRKAEEGSDKENREKRFKSSFDCQQQIDVIEKKKRLAKSKHVQTMIELSIAKRQIKSLEENVKQKELELQKMVPIEVYSKLAERVQTLELRYQPDVTKSISAALCKNAKKNMPKELLRELYSLRVVNNDLIFENEQKDQQLANYRSLFWRSM